MIELAIFIIVVLALWKLRKAIQSWVLVNSDKAEVWAADQKVDMQDDLADLDKKVDKIKEANDGKWFTLDGITSKMQ